MMSLNRKRKIQPGVKLFIALIPFLVLYVLFCYKPLTGWIYAFYEYKPGRKLADMEFAGLKYFTILLENPITRREFLGSLANTIIMSTLGTLTSFVPVLFAVLLNEVRHTRYKKLIQTLTTIPNFIGWVMVYAIAFPLFSSDGLLSNLLVEFGIMENGYNFLANPAHPRLDMILWGLWKGTGWGAIIYLASLGSIDAELYDAASVDGAGRLRRAIHITIPGLLPTYVTLLIMGIGGFLSTGMEQYLLFSNTFNRDKLLVLDLYTYEIGLKSVNYSLATAVGIFKSVVGIILLLLSNWISGKVREEKIF